MKPYPSTGRAGPRRQRGTVLVIGLLMLLVLTITGITAMQTTSLEERMAGNLQHYNMALQVSEAALRGGEDWVTTRMTEPLDSSDGSSGVWVVNAADPDKGNGTFWWDERNDAWWTAHAVAYGTSLPLGDSALTESPRYLVEYQSFVPDSLVVGGIGGPPSGKLFYRITARGKGGADVAAISRTQSTYVRRY